MMKHTLDSPTVVTRACTLKAPLNNPLSESTNSGFGLFVSSRYDYVEVEEPDGGMVLGRWCGSQSAPGPQTSKGNQIRIRFVSDEYFPSEPGFSIHYSVLQQVSSLQLLLLHL